MFPVAIIVIYGMGISLAVCLFYRISKIFDYSFLDVLFKDKLRIFVTYSTFYGLCTSYAAGNPGGFTRASLDRGGGTDREQENSAICPPSTSSATERRPRPSFIGICQFPPPIVTYQVALFK